jgi:hypothetical protein
MKTKPLTFLLALTFLFLFSGSVYAQTMPAWDEGVAEPTPQESPPLFEGLEVDVDALLAEGYSMEEIQAVSDQFRENPPEDSPPTPQVPSEETFDANIILNELLKLAPIVEHYKLELVIVAISLLVVILFFQRTKKTGQLPINSWFLAIPLTIFVMIWTNWNWWWSPLVLWVVHVIVKIILSVAYLNLDPVGKRLK